MTNVEIRVILSEIEQLFLIRVFKTPFFCVSKIILGKSKKFVGIRSFSRTLAEVLDFEQNNFNRAVTNFISPVQRNISRFSSEKNAQLLQQEFDHHGGQNLHT